MPSDPERAYEILERAGMPFTESDLLVVKLPDNDQPLLTICKALLSAVSKLAVDEGCFGLRWEVLDWNRPAIEFYEKLGATFLNERKAVAFDGEALRRVASEFSLHKKDL